MKVIVKYYGSLDGVRAIAEDVKVSELLAQYAVVELDAAYLDELKKVPEVIYIEEPRRVYPTGEVTKVAVTEKSDTLDTQSELGIMQENRQENRLSGKGVLVGIVDSGERVKKNISNKAGVPDDNFLCNKVAMQNENILNNKVAEYNKKTLNNKAVEKNENIFYNENGISDENIVYNAAGYIRLSKADRKEKRYYSDSIYNQKKIIEDYVKKRKDIVLKDLYIDDGYSGLDTKRPQYKRMISDIENRSINCIIVKDLSRFGRDYIEVGRMIKSYLKRKNVCFISVADGYDSQNCNNELYSPFYMYMKSIVNDEYSRDISLKVRTGLEVCMRNGEYVGAFAPYGYLKSPEDKKKLVPDDNVKEIIKMIFMLRAEKKSLQTIADRLNEMEIMTPFEYRKSQECAYKTPFALLQADNGKKKWYPQMVKRILTNEIYAGVLVQSKSKKLNYKIKKSVKTEDGDRIRCEKRELAIVDRELFEKVNRSGK